MKTLFIISSVIYPNHKNGFSYCDKRSIFKEDARFQQTIETVESIKQYAPESDILRIEWWIQDVWDKVVWLPWLQYNYIGNDKLLRKIIDGKFKWAWESLILYCGTKFVLLKEYDYIFKISGRYLLNTNFEIESMFNKNKFTFLRSGKSYSTRLYSFDSYLSFLRRFYLLMFIVLSISRLSLEELRYYFLPKKIVANIVSLWVEWKGGVFAQNIKE